MAYDSATGQIVLFGGVAADNDVLDDTWTYDGSTWTQQFPVTSPSARFAASMAYDAATGQVVLSGGSDDFPNPNGGGSGGTLGDTWTYDGSTWTEQAPAPPTLGASMAYDAMTSQVILFDSGTWAYDGSTWTQQPSEGGPSDRNLAAMAYDEAIGEVVLFGGNDGVLLGDTWTYYQTLLASQTISFTTTAPTNAVVGGAPYTPAASATSGLAVVITLDGTSRGCALVNGTVNFITSGTCLIDANQAGDANYLPAPQVTQSITPLGFSITTASLPGGSVSSKAHKVIYSATLAATRGNPPYRWSLAPGSNPLPPGLKLKRATGLITGRVTMAGTYSFTVQAVDHKTKATKGHPSTQDTATAPLSITIAPGP